MEQTGVAKSRLEQLAAPLRAKGLEVACEALFGMPVDEILDQAKTQGADYIILGSHGHGALFHLFGGSVVTGVLKHSPCPVVVVPVRK
jgi:nucleotide-binding universal stress UspA family protein